MRTKASLSHGRTRQIGQSVRRPPRHPKKLISLRAAARRAGLSVTTMYQWAKRGRTSGGSPIQVVKDDLKNQLLISEESLVALLANRYRPLPPVST